MLKKKVLIIDDEEMFGLMVKANLEVDGSYEVSALMNGREALAVVHNFRPDVILLDLVMPGIGGLDVCQMLNADPVGSTIPIVILSALDKMVDKARAFKLGVVDYLTKPADISEIVRVIEKAVRYK